MIFDHSWLQRKTECLYFPLVLIYLLNLPSHLDKFNLSDLNHLQNA